MTMRAALQPSPEATGSHLRECALAGAAGPPRRHRPHVAHAADGHPAKIHEGTCEALGRVAFPLTGVGATVGLEQTPIATPAPVNPKRPTRS